MNILAIQDMNKIQSKLLEAQLDPIYSFPLLDSSLLEQLHHFPSLLLNSHFAFQAQVNKIIKNPESAVEVVENQSPSSFFKTFAYLIFSIMLPTYEDPISYVNKMVLDKIKCIFYSQEVDLNSISNKKILISNFQTKTVVARFLYTITNNKYSNSIRLKYISYIIQNNPLILGIFQLLYEALFCKLQINLGLYNNQTIGFESAWIPLIEHFGLKYEKDKQFLLVEEKYFITKQKGSFLVGTDNDCKLEGLKGFECENNRLNENQLKVLANINNGSSPSIEQLESIQMDSQSEQLDKPQLNQVSLLKKSIYRPQCPLNQQNQELRNMFKVNFDQSVNQTTDNTNNFSFSPSAINNGFIGPFTSFSSDKLFNAFSRIDQSKSSDNKVTDRNKNFHMPYLFTSCNCCEVKKMKNQIVSKVFQFKNCSQNKIKDEQNAFLKQNNSEMRAYPFRPKSRFLPTQKNQQQPSKEYKIPSFIKLLKKDKSKIDKSISSKSKQQKSSASRPNKPIYEKHNTCLVGQSLVGKINTKFQSISTKNILNSTYQFAKSTARKNQSRSKQHNELSKKISSHLYSISKLQGNSKSSSNLYYPQVKKSQKAPFDGFQGGLIKKDTIATQSSYFSSKIFFNEKMKVDERLQKEMPKIRKTESINYYFQASDHFTKKYY